MSTFYLQQVVVIILVLVKEWNYLPNMADEPIKNYIYRLVPIMLA